jgi:hypothetical protein
MPSDKVMQTKAYASTHYFHVEKKLKSIHMIEVKKRNMFYNLVKIQTCGAKCEGALVDVGIGTKSLTKMAKSAAPPYKTLNHKCMAPYIGCFSNSNKCISKP